MSDAAERSETKPKGRRPRVRLTHENRCRLRGRTFLNERVIQRWADGEPVKVERSSRGVLKSTSLALYRACRELGIETEE